MQLQNHQERQNHFASIHQQNQNPSAKLFQFLGQSAQRVIQNNKKLFSIFIETCSSQKDQTQNTQKEKINVDIIFPMQAAQSQQIQQKQDEQQFNVKKASKVQQSFKIHKKVISNTVDMKGHNAHKKSKGSFRAMSMIQAKEIVTSSKIQKLKQLNIKKYELMQKLKQIDSQLVKNNKKNYLNNPQISYYQNTQNKNSFISEAKVQDMSKWPSPRQIKSFNNNNSLYSHELSTPKTKCNINISNNVLCSSRHKQFEQSLQSKHHKAVQMLKKIHEEKMKRQQKILQKMKKKQETQIVKLKQLKSTKDKEVSVARSRALFTISNKANKSKTKTNKLNQHQQYTNLSEKNIKQKITTRGITNKNVQQKPEIKIFNKFDIKILDEKSINQNIMPLTLVNEQVHKQDEQLVNESYQNFSYEKQFQNQFKQTENLKSTEKIGQY